MIIDTEVLGLLAVASFIAAKLFTILTDRLAFWARLSDQGREIGGYAIMVACGVLMWLTRLNALPGFNEAGRVLTCLIGALGPSAVYDVLFDKPTPPTVDYGDIPEM